MSNANMLQQQSLRGSVNVGNTLKGDRGDRGVTFTPHVDGIGNLSWTNDGDLTNPEPVNIKGPKGEAGEAKLKTVNGIEPDENGNVPIEAIAGDELDSLLKALEDEVASE